MITKYKWEYIPEGTIGTETFRLEYYTPGKPLITDLDKLILLNLWNSQKSDYRYWTEDI